MATLKIDPRELSVISEDDLSSREYREEMEEIDAAYLRSRGGMGLVKKKLHPLLGGPVRKDSKYVPIHTASKSNLSEFTRRVMSGKLLKTNQLQNQLAELKIQLNDAQNENKVLRNLQKRHEGALKKYEGDHAELPQLIRSHNEEIRALKTNNKTLKAQLRECNSKLKDKDAELESLKDSYNKLKKLSSEKNLWERDKLQKKVESLEDVIKDQDEKIQVLSRKVLLESKNYRYHINIEESKHRETQKELSSALLTINKLKSMLVSKEKTAPVPPLSGRLPAPHRRQLQLMPPINNKPLEKQPNVSHYDYTNDNSSVFGSQDTDSELMNDLISPEDSPSPTQDIFPPIYPQSKRPSPAIKANIEADADKGEVFHFECKLPPKHRPGTLQRHSIAGLDVDSTAMRVIEKLKRNIKALDKEKEVSSSLRIRKESVCEEIRPPHTEQNDDREPTEKETVPTIDLTPLKQNKDPEQQKLISMKKNWNEINVKLQEENEKAEQEMRDLCEDQDVEFRKIRKSPGEKSDFKLARRPETSRSSKKDSFIINPSKDEYINSELEKTDKVLRKLSGDRGTVISLGKQTQPSAPKFESCPVVPENTVRTENSNDFQNKAKKQHLLKALKAIDAGQDPNSEGSDIDDETVTMFPDTAVRNLEIISDQAGNIVTGIFGPNARQLGNDSTFTFNFSVGGS